MNRSMRVEIVGVAAGFIGLLAGSTIARGQCSIFREGVPDFDQVRAALPNTGSMYCVPTAATNWLGYISNNGLPSVLGGPFNWQEQAQYNYVTNQIDFVGSEMNTSSTGGTQGGKAKDGLEDILDTRAPGKFTVSTYFGHVRLDHLYNFMAENRLVLICYGRYQLNGAGTQWNRVGGHCVTLTGMLDACAATSRLRYRDPGDDGNDASQSTFTSRVTRAEQVSFNTSDGTVTRQWLRDLGVGGANTTLRCLDRHITIRPRFSIYPSPFNGSWVRYDLLNSIRAQGLTTNTFATADAQPIDQMTMSSDGSSMFYTTIIGGPDAFPSFYRQDILTGQSTFLGTLQNYTPLATDRFGDVYMFRAGAVRRYDASGNSLVQLAQYVPGSGFVAECMQWNDGSDRLFVAGPMGLQLLDRTLAGNGLYSWPASVVRNGGVRFDITPSGTIVVGSTNSPTFYHLRFNPLIARLDLLQTVTIPGVAGIKALQMTESNLGRLVVMTNIGVREYTRNPTSGAFEPAAETLFAAVPAGNTLAISKGRSNFQVGIHDQPAWNDVYQPETAPTIPDCATDVNFDGLHDVNDIFAFLNLWFARERAADFDVSGNIAITDIFAFLNAWFAGC